MVKNNFDKILCWRMTPTRTWKCTRYIMQISYLYTSDFPARQTSRNNNKLIQNGFWLWLSIVLIVLRNAQINRQYQSEGLHNPAFIRKSEDDCEYN